LQNPALPKPERPRVSASPPHYSSANV